jgi:N-methylhydantoinase A/oxoprolinase/acetone carboxylase beta subunit
MLGRIVLGGDLGGRGQLQLDLGAARQAIQQRVANPLGIDVNEAAQAIIAVANNKMAASMRLVSVDRGQDPRDFGLVAFGGAGPLHASELMRETGFQRILVPLFPGITSALGCVLSDLSTEASASVHRLLAETDPDELRGNHDAIRRIALERIREQGHGEEETLEELIGEMCYSSQTSSIPVPLCVKRKDVDLERLARGILRDDAHHRGKQVLRFGGTQLSVPIYNRFGLRPGFRGSGPALLEQLDSTILVGPEDLFEVNASGSIMIEASK